MRVRGRRIYPDTLQERRILMALGGTPLYAPRGVSPYLIARRLARAVGSESPDVSFVRKLMRERPKQHPGAEIEPASSDAAGTVAA